MSIPDVSPLAIQIEQFAKRAPLQRTALRFVVFDSWTGFIVSELSGAARLLAALASLGNRVADNRKCAALQETSALSSSLRGNAVTALR